jgi:hypothetical protein
MFVAIMIIKNLYVTRMATKNKKINTVTEQRSSGYPHSLDNRPVWPQA